MLLADDYSSKIGNYSFQRSLSGHMGPIVTLAATEDGKLLASGGIDGTLVWDLNRYRQLDIPSSPAMRGATTAIAWVKRDEDPSEILAFGTQSGYLVLWQQKQETGGFHEVYCNRLNLPEEVTGVAFDSSSNRLAVCHRGGYVYVGKLKATGTRLEQLYVHSITDFTPSSIAFGVMEGNEREVLLFNVYEGNIICLRGPTGLITEDWTLGTFIGSAVVDSERSILCVDDGSRGAMVYNLHERTKTKEFAIPVTKQKMPRKVCFANKGTHVVGGSDHGVVHIFNRRTGEAVDQLKVGNETEWVQTVTAASFGGVTTIFAARSRHIDGPNEITIWRKREEHKMLWVVVSAGNVCVLLATVLFFYQSGALRG